MSKIIHIQKCDFSLPVIQILHCDIAKISDELQPYKREESEETLSIPCVLSIEVESVEPTFLARLVEVLRQFNFLPIGLKTEDDSFFEQAHYAGLALFNKKTDQSKLFDELENSQQPNNTTEKPPYIHHGNLANGQQVYAEECDLIVLGDVEKGAEAVADGNIYIGGTLSGGAYAGNSGFMNIDQITVSAYVFEPEMVSIAGFYQLKEDIPEQYFGLPVKAQFISQRFQYSLE